MIDIEKLKPLLVKYRNQFLSKWGGEKYKWEALQWFRDHWDINAASFGEMFEQATAKTINLLASGYAYPRAMIINFANEDDDYVRDMFRNLYDESQDLSTRVQAFQVAAEAIRNKFDDGSWRNHYQNTNAISTYLWLKFPDKYYIYRYELYRETAKAISSDYYPKANGSVDTMLGGFHMYDEICAEIDKDNALCEILNESLTPTCYPDKFHKTLTVDFGHYIGKYLPIEMEKQKAVMGWLPEDYQSPISVEAWVELLENPAVFKPDSLQIMKRLKDYGGQATCTQLAVKYGGSVNFYNAGSSALAKRVAEATGTPMVEIRPGEKRWWPILFLGKPAGQEDEGVFIWKLREELNAALEQIDMSDILLYTTDEVGSSSQGYWLLTARPSVWSFSSIQVGETQEYTFFNENGNKRRVFQNFIDAKVGDIVICYEANPVKKVVAIARITHKTDGKDISVTKTEGLIEPIDFARLKEAPELEKMEFMVQPNGTLFKLTEGEYRFIMDLIREENPLRQADAVHPRYTEEDFLDKVYMTRERFQVLISLLKFKRNIILQGAPGVGKTFAARKLAYAVMGEVDDSRIELVQFHQNYSYEDFVMGFRPDGSTFKLTDGIFYRFCQTAANYPNQPYFFIIDEINRGNLSKIFGELLMLIDRDYRGTKATLAYSGQSFSVPENLYIIGMMNTADRSLAMIDYALRRRFSFFDMEPGFTSKGFSKYQSSFANETFDALIDQIKLLNRAISEDNSLGPGFRIGHSYFCGREELGCTDEWMRSVVEFDILPTLREYWFDDPKSLAQWEKNLRGVFDD